MADTYLIFDTMNCLMRAKYSIKENDLEDKVNLGVHLLLNILMKCYNKFLPSRMVFCFEGYSWRKNIIPSYKANRAALKLKKTPKELEEDELFLKASEDFRQFLNEKTNTLVLQHNNAEADDMIARFIEMHPQDLHIIVSSDTDFVQLLDRNVMIYDGIKQAMITLDGVFNDMGHRLEFSVKNDGKIKIESVINDDFKPEIENWKDYSLFTKLIRGDTSDNISSVYPGIRQKSTKNKAGINDIFLDKEDKGFIWNNFMNTEYEDIDGNKILVKDKYEQNCLLIDLKRIPENYKTLFDNTIIEQKHKEIVKNVGIHFLSFASKFKLNEYAIQSNELSIALSKYIKEELVVG